MCRVGSQPMDHLKLLIIEDDDLQSEIYEEALSSYDITRVTSGSEALKTIASNPPHLIILDHILDDGEEGLTFLNNFKEVLPHVPVIVVSGALEAQQQIHALQGPRRAHYCLAKPVDLTELMDTIETALNECGETEIVRQFEALERSRRIDVEELLSRSTDRLLRQNEIKKLVHKADERPNISALARQFNVARRTIIRDLQELIRRDEISQNVYPKWESGSEKDED